ncbi:MAG: hypothetical protein KDA28_00120 [Phycisphaerales bacterium]|nr:hypothetical protein [Phycisphaerales bacterium]
MRPPTTILLALVACLSGARHAVASVVVTPPVETAPPSENVLSGGEPQDDDASATDEAIRWLGALTDANESLMLLRFEPLLVSGSRFREPMASWRDDRGDDLLGLLEKAAFDASPTFHVRGASEFDFPAQGAVGGSRVEEVWITRDPITLPDDAEGDTVEGVSTWTDRSGIERTHPVHARLVDPTTLVIATDPDAIGRIVERYDERLAIDDRFLLSCPDLDLGGPIVILRDLTRNETFPDVDQYAVTIPDVVDGAVMIHWIGGGREEHQNRMFQFVRLLPFEPSDWAPETTAHGRRVTLRPEHTDLYQRPPERVLMIAFGVYDFR